MCVIFEIMTFVVITHHQISSITIALGRYVHESISSHVLLNSYYLLILDSSTVTERPWKDILKKRTSLIVS